MRIAFFTPTLNVGGYEKVVLGFANELAETTDHTVQIVCGNDSGELRKAISQRVSVVCLNCKTRNLLFKLTGFIREQKPDVLYTGFRVYNSIAVIAKRLSGCRKTKICITQHGYEYSNKLLELIYASVLKKADLFVAVTESLRVFEKTALRLRCKNVVVGNPVLPKNMIIQEMDDPWFLDDIPVVCVCARLSKDKNIDLAIEIKAELDLREIKTKLLILGDGPERKNLQKKAGLVDSDNSVRFAGFVKNPIQYMKNCAVYLHTCDREGFGNTVVEALYAGIPVVTTECGGPVDLIENGRYGVVFGDGRANDACLRGAQAVCEVLHQKWNTEELRWKAEQFSAKVVTQKLLNYMENIS